LFLFLSAGCTADLTLPDNLQIGCGPGGACPEGYVCRAEIERCIAVDALDTTPPQLVSEPTVTPSIGGHATPFTLAFEVSEPLAEAPAPTALGRPLSLREQSGESYVFDYLPSGTEPEGATPIELSLVDRYGNLATGLSAGALVFDLTPPSVVAGSIDIEPEVAGDNSVVFVTFGVDEPLGAPAVVVVGAEGLATLNEAQPSDGRLLFRYPVTADQPEGEVSVAVRLEDAVGNVASQVGLGSVLLDFTPPALVGTPTFERCDGRTEARLAANELWLNEPDCPGGPGFDRRDHAVTVYFTLSELPRGGGWPLVTVEGGAAETIWMDEEQSVPPYYVVRFHPSGEEPESADGASVWVETQDEARNEAKLEVGRLRFDFTPPDTPAAEATQRGLVYVRDPFGSELSDYLPRMQLRIDGNAFAEEGVVRLWAVRDPALPGTDPDGLLYVRSLLGSARFAPDEDIYVEAGSADRPVIYVSFEDLAGNESDADPSRAGNQASPVRLVEWVGTLNGKVVGDRSSNPHELLEGVSEGDEPLPLDRYARAVDSQAPYLGIARADRESVATARSDSAPWVRATAPGEPPRLTFHGMAYHERSGRLVVFGGRRGWAPYGASGTTWEWDGRTWLERDPAGSPAAREGLAMAYDAARGRIVLFGGAAESSGACGSPETTMCSDTWEWDGVGWGRHTPDRVPPARAQAALAYDAARGRTILFGGERFIPNGVGYLGDTWEWDGETWTERVLAEGPSARFGHALAYDPVRERVVLFGGDDGGVMLADTWEWDGDSWQQAEPRESPRSRRFHALAWDGRHESLLLYAGNDGGPFDDTWRYDGETWTRLQPPLSPLARAGHAAAWDGEQVVVGGPGDGAGWTWDGDTWDEPGPEGPAPAGRRYAGLASDTTRSRVLLFGGDPGEPGLCGEADERLCADTWTWDGEAWRQEAPEHAPAPRSMHGLAYDPMRERAVLFGGCAALDERGNCVATVADTWEWDGADWLLRSTPVAPSPRSGPLLAYDPVSRVVALHGGVATAGETCGDAERRCVDSWSWDGDSWREEPDGPAPPARSESAWSWDPRGRGFVLYGGAGWETGACGEADGILCSDTWTYASPLWANRQPAHDAGARWGHALGLDAARGRVVLFAGYRGFGQLRADTWTWTGDDWREEALFAPAPGRYGHSLAHDPAGGGLLLFGGSGSGAGTCLEAERSTFCPQTWRYAPARWRPHLTAAFDLRAAATLEPSGADPSERSLDRVSVVSVGGGRGHTRGAGAADGEQVPGLRAAVSAFGRGGWVELFRTDVPNDPERFSLERMSFAADWTCGEPSCVDATIDHWMAADGKLYLDFAPLEVAGASPDGGEIALDYVELRLRYWRTGCQGPTLLDPEGTPAGTPCQDGDAATAGEVCQAGVCRAR